MGVELESKATTPQPVQSGHAEFAPRWIVVGFCYLINRGPLRLVSLRSTVYYVRLIITKSYLRLRSGFRTPLYTKLHVSSLASLGTLLYGPTVL